MHAYEPIDSIDGLFALDEFHARHIGVNRAQESQMLEKIGVGSRQKLIEETIPKSIYKKEALDLPAPCTEAQALGELKTIAQKNEVWRSFIGAGYFGTFTPEAIRRNLLENPGWYTAYTPYQAEVAQGRLEALMNFQQMVVDLTGMHTSNASLLDEATAVAEAMAAMKRASKAANANKFFLDKEVHPQVIAVVLTRAHWMGLEVVVGDADGFLPSAEFFAGHVQTPDTRGAVRDFTALSAKFHAQGARLSIGTDLLALMLMKSAGAMGADVAVGSAQRFGVPMGYGGPHAAFMAVKEDLVRMMPGRIIGVSVDALGKPAYRMSLQTREQHIRRDKATSNICTAQALLANMASFFAVYHGPQGLYRIALRANAMARLLVKALGLRPISDSYFDTVTFAKGSFDLLKVSARTAEKKINLRMFESGEISVACDETTTLEDVADLVYVLNGKSISVSALQALKLTTQPESIPKDLLRTDPVLTHPVFNSYHSETEFVRYLKRLENKDISLVHSMIALGSCTMKLNAAAEMAPVTWPEFANLHPFAPANQTEGYREMLAQLGQWLESITGFKAVSFQPNSGAQGEYAGLLAIRRYQQSIGEGHRDVCLIPSSAHGTNPATAQMMGMKIIVVTCDSQGNIDLADLTAKIDPHKAKLSALMVTYPSTHGVFESAIKDICAMVHKAGGQVYMDGANLNAQAGLTRPGDIGADVCHMNLHKTFCIPHGGGGPGMGPIAVAEHLAPFLASDPFTSGAHVASLSRAESSAVSSPGISQSANSVSAAPFGSALITTISWMYIRMMGASGIRKATEVAILNANYVAARLQSYFPILYKGENGRIAHECILDLRNLKAEMGVTAEDIAKRLMDYGFHSPTLSFPVADTLMVEPTESESKSELDRFCEAMIAIHGELQKIKSGAFDREDNPLKNAPHTAQEVAGPWGHAYDRNTAVFPLPWVRAVKFWPSVKRIDNAAGDRNLVCTCPPLDAYT